MEKNTKEIIISLTSSDNPLKMTVIEAILMGFVGGICCETSDTNLSADVSPVPIELGSILFYAMALSPLVRLENEEVLWLDTCKLVQNPLIDLCMARIDGRLTNYLVRFDF